MDWDIDNLDVVKALRLEQRPGEFEFKLCSIRDEFDVILKGEKVDLARGLYQAGNMFKLERVYLLVAAAILQRRSRDGGGGSAGSVLDLITEAISMYDDMLISDDLNGDTN